MSPVPRTFRRAWILGMLILVAAAASVAAQDVTGALQGTVVSPEGKSEPEVRVRVSGPNLQGTRETITDRAGFFQFPALPPGSYALEFTRVGLRRLEVRDVAVELGRTTGLGRLTVEAQPVEMAPVVVATTQVRLDPARTTAGGNLAARDYDALPVDRDYKSLITVLPHANNSYRGDPVNVGGSTGLENQYYIDGVNVTDTQNAHRAMSVPYDFVRAVDVKTAGYEAQYGRALGAVVNAVTYSGTNDFETSLFGFVQPFALSMTPHERPVLTERGALSYDYGVRVSGPVARDRLWFSAAINPRIDQVEREIPGFGFFLDRASSVRYATKLTWRARPSTNVELSVLGDPTVEDKVELPAGATVALTPDPLLTRVESGGSVASLRVTVTPNPKLLLQASAAHSWDGFSVGGRTPQATSPPYFDYTAGTVEGGVNPALATKSRTSFSLRSTYQFSRHTVVLGSDYEDAKTRSGGGYYYIARLSDTTWYESDEFSAATNFHNRSPAAYVQDTWRATDRLALNAGLRWSGQFMSGQSGRTTQRITDEWQPRVGFVWQADRAATQRVFGSYGRFYLMVPTNLAVLWFVDFFGYYSYYRMDPRTPGATPYDVVDGSMPASMFEKQIPDLHAENFDEFTLGYERMLGPGTKLTVRGMRRDLRSSFEFGVDGSRDTWWVLGTPGKGDGQGGVYDFSFLPPPKRQYTALEVAAEGSWRRLDYRTSYVLSRSWGNYPGLFSSDQQLPWAGWAFSFAMPHQAVNSTGYLPNDRTHVFKLSGSCDAGFGLVTGAFLTFESGAPINEFAAGPFGPIRPAFVKPRGSVGRTPWLWNLDLRFTYALAVGRAKARLMADILHIGNPRRATTVDEVHYLTEDLSDVNPNYLAPTAYQPPMAGRIGLQVSF